MKLSISQINSYINCPQKAFREYILKQKPAVEPEYFLAGRAFEKAVDGIIFDKLERMTQKN